MVKARVILQNLKTLSYNFSPSDLQPAADFTQKLEELYHMFYSKLPNQSGILIRPPEQKSLCSTRRREHTAYDADFASLPPHKKVKKSSHRFGIKVDRKRKQSEIQVNICIKIVTQSSSQLYFLCLTIIYNSTQSSPFSKKSHLVYMSHNSTILYQVYYTSQIIYHRGGEPERAMH